MVKGVGGRGGAKSTKTWGSCMILLHSVARLLCLWPYHPKEAVKKREKKLRNFVLWIVVTVATQT